MTGARKKTGPRCRTIGGVVYDLKATDRKPPCGRGRPSSGPSLPPRASSPPKAPAAPSQPAISDIVYTYESGPIGGYDLFAIANKGEGVSTIVGHYATRELARAAAETARKTGQAPPSTHVPVYALPRYKGLEASQPAAAREAPKREPGAWERGKAARRVVVNDDRVREREERERAHRERERLEAMAPKRTALADVGKLPKRDPAKPALKASERAVVDKVRKSNRAGLLSKFDATQPSTRAIALDLVKRGVLLEYGHAAGFYLPEFLSDAERLIAASARLAGKPAPPVAMVGVASNARVSDYDRRRQKVVPLPAPIDPSKARVGDRVSVFYYGQNEPNHATLTELPGTPGQYGRTSTEPTVKFDAGSSEGMNRHVRWEQVYAGWLDPNVNWKPWKG